MRIGILLVLALLTGCAVQPQAASTSYYRGVYAPGAATIAADGSFVSTTKVASVDKLDVAGEAALARLVAAAQAQGMSYALVSSVHTDESAGLGYRIEGHVFRAGNAPAEAVALGEIAVALRHHLGMVPERPKRKLVPTAAGASSGVIEQREPAGQDDPIVITAPDFVT